MPNKLNRLLEVLLSLVDEDDKARMSTFIDPKHFGRISDEDKQKWYGLAREASDEFHRLYYSNRALGYPKDLALKKAARAVSKEKTHSSEHDVYLAGEGNPGGSGYPSGFERAAGKDNTEASASRREAFTKLIDAVKSEFKDKEREQASKILALYLINSGADEIIPTTSIPHYSEVASMLKRIESDSDDIKRGMADNAFKVATSDDGIGASKHLYYKVASILKSKAKGLISAPNESFMTELKALLGGGKGEKDFRLSNLEPMIDIIKRDMDNSPFKFHGLHLQGVTREEGEDMLRNIPSVQHKYEGDALVIPIEHTTNLNQVLRKSIPGKKVILFGFNKQPQPIRKGWEGFPYKVTSGPTVIGAYSLSTETKAEALLKNLTEGFQCTKYDHGTQSCGMGRPCEWKGFPSMAEDMIGKECRDYE